MNQQKLNIPYETLNLWSVWPNLYQIKWQMTWVLPTDIALAQPPRYDKWWGRGGSVGTIKWRIIVILTIGQGSQYSMFSFWLCRHLSPNTNVFIWMVKFVLDGPREVMFALKALDPQDKSYDCAWIEIQKVEQKSSVLRKSKEQVQFLKSWTKRVLFWERAC